MTVPLTFGGRGPIIFAINATEFTIATILIALRLWHRQHVQKTANWALGWTCAAWVLGVMHFSFLTVSISYGTGQHIQNLSPQQAQLAGQWVWATQAVQIVNYSVGKASAAAFILTLQGPTHPRRAQAMKLIIVINFISSIITVFMALFQCNPPKKLWEPEIAGRCNTKPNIITGEVQAGINGATDFYLALYPILLLHGLQMRLRIKVGVGLLLGLGAFMGVCAIMKALQLRSIAQTSDPTWNLFKLLCWSNTEMWVTVIIPSIPPLWPLFTQTYRTWSGKTHTSGHTSGDIMPTYPSSRRRRPHGFSTLTTDSDKHNTRSTPANAESQEFIVPLRAIKKTDEYWVTSSSKPDPTIDSLQIEPTQSGSPQEAARRDYGVAV